MAHPPDDRVTINVKSVSAKSWEQAKAAAIRRGKPMGAWLSDAIDHKASLEAGDRIDFSALPPANLPSETGNPGPAAPMSPGELADMMRGLAALATASGTPPAKATTRRAYGLADDLMRDAQGVPRKPRLVGKAPGQSLLQNGKATPALTERSKG